MREIHADGVIMFDAAPAAEDFRDAAKRGLGQRPPTLPCKFFYDEYGSKLFDAICELEEYYVTRTEAAIMAAGAAEMARIIGPKARLVEFGSGSSTKTRALLDHLEQPAVYVPVDISRDHLLATAVALNADYPDLKVRPVAADYTKDLTLPKVSDAARTVVYFPGSTLGNFVHADAVEFLTRTRRMAGKGGGVLIGIDMVKDRDVLRAAYNDREGVTAAFNRNVLVRLAEEDGVRLDPAGFDHLAVWDEAESRMEMRLVARGDQAIEMDGEVHVRLGDGEHIVTEYSHKYTLESFGRLAAAAGLRVEHVWTDPKGWFTVQFAMPV